ncbi:FHA domain-containing protein [Candidatus Riflebacteria bacterium]
MFKLCFVMEDKTYDIYDVKIPLTRIGRDKNSNDIVLNSPRTSRQHATITKTDEGFVVKDTSSGGTFVNGVRVTQQVLKKDDKLRFADVEALFIDREEGALKVEGNDSVLELQKVLEEDYLSEDFKKLEQFLEKLILPELPGDRFHIMLTEIKDYLKKLKGQLVGRMADQKSLLEISKIIGSKLEIKALLKKILKVGLNFFNAERGFLMLQEQRSGKLEVKARENILEDKGALMESLSKSITTRCFEKGELIIVNDATIETEFAAMDSIAVMAIRSILCIPLIHKGEKLGVFYMDHLRKTHIFHNSKAGYYKSFGEIVSQAIKNSNRYETMGAKALF